MKNIFFVAVILLISFSQSFGQWNWKYPYPQGNTLNKMQLLDTTGYAVGVYGTAIYTNDTGLHWSNFDSLLTSEHLHGLFFLNDNLGYFVGDNGTILERRIETDTIWTKIETGTHYAIRTVAFANEQTGIFAGYKGLAFTSDGENLTQVNTNTNFDLHDVTFIKATDAIIVGDSGLVLKSTNAGNNWTKISSGQDKPLYDVYFPSEQTGYIVGQKGLILKTIDAGESWVDVSNSAVGNDFYSVHFINDTAGYVGGSYGTIMSTIDGGQNWLYKGIPTDVSIYGVHQLVLPTDTTSDTTIVCGNFGAIFYTDTTTASYNWKNIAGGNSHSITSMDFSNSGQGLAVGGDLFGNIPDIIQTYSNGDEWESLTIDTIVHFLTGVDYSDSGWPYLCGTSGSVYRQDTIDDGDTIWFPLPSGTINDLYAIEAINDSSIFAVGINGTVIKTISSDTLWETLNTPTELNLYDFDFINESMAYAVGEEGVVLRINFSGNSVHKVKQVWTPMYTIHFLNDSLGFMAGFSGKIFKISITDTLVFTHIPSGVTTPLNEINFPTDSIGYISGDGGLVLKTTDAGNTWYPVYTGTDNSLYTLGFDNDTMGFVAGAGLTILKTTIGGGSVITPGIFENKKVENPIKLYPNPVSDIVFVEYELHQKSQVSISLIDLSGKELIKMVPGWQGNGIQRISIPLNKLHQGIYLVMVQIDNEAYARKLVVLP